MYKKELLSVVLQLPKNKFIFLKIKRSVLVTGLFLYWLEKFLLLLYLVYEVVKTLIFGSAVSAYPTIIASVLLLGGI